MVYVLMERIDTHVYVTLVGRELTVRLVSMPSNWQVASYISFVVLPSCKVTVSLLYPPRSRGDYEMSSGDMCGCVWLTIDLKMG